MMKEDKENIADTRKEKRRISLKTTGKKEQHEQKERAQEDSHTSWRAGTSGVIIE